MNRGFCQINQKEKRVASGNCDRNFKYYEKKCESIMISEGYNLLARNFRIGKNEVDLLMEKDNIIIAVEVKFRNNDRYFPDIRKQISKNYDSLSSIFPDKFIRMDFFLFNENNSFRIENISLH